MGIVRRFGSFYAPIVLTFLLVKALFLVAIVCTLLPDLPVEGSGGEGLEVRLSALSKKVTDMEAQRNRAASLTQLVGALKPLVTIVPAAGKVAEWVGHKLLALDTIQLGGLDDALRSRWSDMHSAHSVPRNVDDAVDYFFGRWARQRVWLPIMLGTTETNGYIPQIICSIRSSQAANDDGTCVATLSQSIRSVRAYFSQSTNGSLIDLGLDPSLYVRRGDWPVDASSMASAWLNASKTASVPPLSVTSEAVQFELALYGWVSSLIASDLPLLLLILLVVGGGASKVLAGSAKITPPGHPSLGDSDVLTVSLVVLVLLVVMQPAYIMLGSSSNMGLHIGAVLLMTWSSFRTHSNDVVRHNPVHSGCDWGVVAVAASAVVFATINPRMVGYFVPGLAVWYVWCLIRNMSSFTQAYATFIASAVVTMVIGTGALYVVDFPEMDNIMTDIPVTTCTPRAPCPPNVYTFYKEVDWMACYMAQQYNTSLVQMASGYGDGTGAVSMSVRRAAGYLSIASSACSGADPAPLLPALLPLHTVPLHAILFSMMVYIMGRRTIPTQPSPYAQQVGDGSGTPVFRAVRCFEGTYALLQLLFVSGLCWYVLGWGVQAADIVLVIAPLLIWGILSFMEQLPRGWNVPLDADRVPKSTSFDPSRIAGTARRNWCAMRAVNAPTILLTAVLLGTVIVAPSVNTFPLVAIKHLAIIIFLGVFDALLLTLCCNPPIPATPATESSSLGESVSHILRHVVFHNAIPRCMYFAFAVLSIRYVEDPILGAMEEERGQMGYTLGMLGAGVWILLWAIPIATSTHWR